MTTKKLTELSVFFPCFNEEENIEKLLNTAIKVIPRIAEKYEIIVINDGSTDNTKKIAEAYVKKYPNIKLINKRNEGGYGGALRRGLKEAKYKWIFYTDADLQFNMSEIEKFVKVANTSKYDLILGYRKKRAEGFQRNLTAIGMKYWNYIFINFPLDIKDIDCAFKLIKKEVVKNTLPIHSTSNLASTEFLIKAYRKGYKYSQIGVSHYLRMYGTSTCGGITNIYKVIKDTFKLIKILLPTDSNKKSIIEKVFFIFYISLKNLLMVPIKAIKSR